MPRLSRRHLLKVSLVAPLAVMGATAARAAVHEVRIQNFAFVPNQIAMAPGDTLRVINADRAPHTLTADDGSFDTGRLRRNAVAELKPTEPGVHSFHCAIHPRMKGTLVIG